MTYSPHDLLPAPIPSTIDPPQDYFYESVAKHLIKDTVRITSNGLPIDLHKVEELENELEVIASKVKDSIAANPIIVNYLSVKYSAKVEAYKLDQTSKLKSVESLIVPFNYKKPEHRSYFMHLYASQLGIDEPSDLLPSGVPKWPAALVKKLSSSKPILQRLLTGTLKPEETAPAMKLLAEHKAIIKNRSYNDNIATPKVIMPEFNPNSPDDKHYVFTNLLGYESGKLTDGYEKYERDLAKSIKYGKPAPTEPKNKWSWGRKQLESLVDQLTDPNEISLFKDCIEFSYGDKISSTFIPAFYNYTIDGRLYSNLKLLGAKSARFTSSNPNMLQLPSTGSIYAKAVKKCFISSPGKIILTADFNALEDRVLASITNDEGKCALLEDSTLDGHCYNALGYYTSEVEQFLDTSLDYKDKVRQFHSLVESKHKELKDIRQRSKAVTFKLAYGGMPDAHKRGAITEEIYNNYHNLLYPGVRSYIDNYVVPTAEAKGKLHLGLGFYIKTDFASNDSRTLHNASIQFWSILSIIAINKLHSLIDAAGLQDDVKVISTIYDSIYIECTKTPSIIKWTNDNLISCMTKDFIPNQRIPNTAESEIGYNWADLFKLPVNSTEDEIEQILLSMEK